MRWWRFPHAALGMTPWRCPVDAVEKDAAHALRRTGPWREVERNRMGAACRAAIMAFTFDS